MLCRQQSITDACNTLHPGAVVHIELRVRYEYIMLFGSICLSSGMHVHGTGMHVHGRIAAWLQLEVTVTVSQRKRVHTCTQQCILQCDFLHVLLRGDRSWLIL
jgi:hypothetical protein